MIGVIGIIASVFVLMFLSLKGVHPVLFALAGTVVVIFTNGLDFWESLTAFSGGVGGFTGAYFILLMLGGIYGVLMRESGCARSIASVLMKIAGAKFTLLAIGVVVFILSLGGVSAFVIIFAVYPFAVPMFREANISKDLMPATILWGIATMCSFPGAPSSTNAILSNCMGTNTWAAPVLSIIIFVIHMILGTLYLGWCQKRLSAQGIGFVAGPKDTDAEIENLPNFVLSLIPVLIVIVVGFVTKDMLSANDSINLSIFIAIVFVAVTNWKRLSAKINAYTVEGITNCLAPLINTGVLVGYSSVISSTAAFGTFTDMAVGLADAFNPYIAGAVCISLLSFIIASPLTATQIFSTALAPIFKVMNINPEGFHKVLMIASNWSCNLPHCSVLIMMANVCGVEFKKAYKYIFGMCVILPLIETIIALALAAIGVA